MGDKSPKDTQRKKKQDEAEKDRKKADAYKKAHPVASFPIKKGK